MNKYTIIQRLPEGTFTRQQIMHAAQIINPSFKETQLRYLIGILNDFELIVRTGRNQYKKAEEDLQKKVYTGIYSKTALKIISEMQKQFPLLSYRIWELSWLNEFFNHQLMRNQIYLEVEKDGCDFVFSFLKEKKLGGVLLKPKYQDISRYTTDNGIIIDRLVSEAPLSHEEFYQVPLEKLIVDLFANKNLMLSKGDYPSAIEAMFAKYRINQVAMLRYARRRNKEKAVIEFLRDRTTVEMNV